MEQEHNEVKCTFPIGTRIGDGLEVLGLLGQGENGHVYKARRLLLDQNVAIKILNFEKTVDDIAIQRFQKEASLLATFDHPHIVKLLSFGTLHDGQYIGQPYMVLELLEGKTLAQILGEHGALSQEDALPIFSAICQGLDYAHQRGIIHRDIKPANIMVLADGPKILDFGVVKSLDPADQKLTKTGQLVGSANYMSPEQCRSEKVDQRSDLYSLGCLMYETLTGKAPMDADSSYAVMANQMEKVLTDVPAVHGISQSLRKSVLKCLEKQPEKRYQSALELNKALLASVGAATNSRGDSPKSIWYKSKSVQLVCALALCGAAAAALVSLMKPSGQFVRVNSLDGGEKHVKSKSSFLRSSGHKPPPKILGLENLKNRDEWIHANARYSGTSLTTLVDEYNYSVREHIELKVPGLPPDGDAIENRLRLSLNGKSADVEPAQWRLYVLRDLALLAVARSDNEGLKTILKELQQPVADKDLNSVRMKYLYSVYLLGHSLEQSRGRFDEAAKFSVLQLPLVATKKEKAHVLNAAAADLLAAKRMPEARARIVQSLELVNQCIKSKDFNIADLTEVGAYACQLQEGKRFLEIVKRLPEWPPVSPVHTDDQTNLILTIAASKVDAKDYNAALALFRKELPVAARHKNNLVAPMELLNLHSMHELGLDKEIPLQLSGLLETLRTSSHAQYLNVFTEGVNKLNEWSIDSSSLLTELEIALDKNGSRKPGVCGMLLLHLATGMYKADKLQPALDLTSKSVPYLERAAALHGKKATHDLIRSAINTQMLILTRQKKFAAARLKYREGLKFKCSTDTAFNSQQLNAEIFAAEGNTAKAIQVLELLLSSSRGPEIATINNYANCVCLLAAFYQRQNEDQKAYDTVLAGIRDLEKYRGEDLFFLDSLYSTAASLADKLHKPDDAKNYRAKSTGLRGRVN